MARRFSAVSGLFRYAHEEGYLSQNPAAHVQSAITAAEPAGKTETLQEARRLLEELTGDNAQP